MRFITHTCQLKPGKLYEVWDRINVSIEKGPSVAVPVLERKSILLFLNFYEHYENKRGWRICGRRCRFLVGEQIVSFFEPMEIDERDEIGSKVDKLLQL